MARASKWFSYGFRPKTKGNFVVEDVGCVSEAEEDYGDFQAMRVDKEAEGNSSDYWRCAHSHPNLTVLDIQ